MRLIIFPNGSDYAEYTRKSRLTEDESKYHENKKGLYGWNINFVLGKNGGHWPSSLGGGTLLNM